MEIYTISTLLALGVFVSAGPTIKPSALGHDGHCKTVDLPIQAQANNVKLPPYPNSTLPGVLYEYLNFNSSALPRQLVNGTFNISATYCEPTVKVDHRENTIQVLLHGLSGTKEYWNGYNGAAATFPGQYSWVAHAQSQGYATLAIDSLGNGQSDHPDPVDIVQGPLQLAILESIIQSLRRGALPSITDYEKVVLVSHSYGSVIARLVAQFFPTNGADAYILTATSNKLPGLGGFVAATHAQSASAVKPEQFGQLVPGYLAVAPQGVRDGLYPLDGKYDPKMLQVDIDEPHVFAVGEIAASQSANAVPSNFTGPVLVITGRQDQIVCGNGNITAFVPDCGVGNGSNPDGTRVLFPKASRFDAYVPDDSAHAINTQYSASESFGAAHQWLQTVGF